jgi:hypothetical protein
MNKIIKLPQGNKNFRAQNKNKKVASTRLQAAFRAFKARKNVKAQMAPKISNDLALTNFNVNNKPITDNYLKALLFPETAENARIPSRYPLQSATFHKHITIKSNVNALGNMVLLFNPYYLQEVGITFTPLAINTAATLNLTTAETTTGYSPVPVAFGLPANTYSDYRLVSASMKIIVNTPNLNATGIIGGGLVSLPGSSATDRYSTGGNSFPLSGDLTIQANIDQSMYFKQADVSKHEDMRICYYPFDPTYETFIDTNFSRVQGNESHVSSVVFCAYISAAAASTAFTLELDYNFETLIYPTSKGYIPLGITSESYDAGKAVRLIISDENNITKTGSNINQVVQKEESTFLSRLLKAGSGLGKLALQHLPEMIAAII